MESKGGKIAEGMENGNRSGKSAEFIDASGKNKETTKTNSTVYIVFLSLLLDLLAFTIILPLLPSLLEHYRINDKDGLYSKLSDSVSYFRELVGAPVQFNSVLFGGVLGSMFSFLQFLISPIAGGLSDYYGRKPILLVSLVGIAFSYALWAISSNFGLFVLARFVGGLSKGNISLSMAIITDVSNKENRGKGMALVGIAFSLGFIVGPLIGKY
jgi:MFS family permease